MLTLHSRFLYMILEERLNLTSITLTVTGAHAWATVTGPLTSGMVGVPVTMEYDAAWAGLTKNLVCRCGEWDSDGGEPRTILNVEETAVVAHEVMKSGLCLYLGLEGYSPDGKLVMPTTWARCGMIQSGANTGADLSADPTLPVWSQLQTEIGQIKRDALTQEQLAEIQTCAQSATQATADAEQAREHAAAAAECAAVSAEAAGNAAASAEASMENARASAAGTAELANKTLQLQQAAEAAAVRAEAAAGALQDGVYVLPVGGDELGGVKNGGNVVINADGTMDAPDNAPTDEQVGNAVSAYLDEHPVAAGATEEQAAQIQANTQSADVLNAVLHNSVLYEWPGLDNALVPKYEGATIAVSVSTGAFARRAVAGHRYMLNNSIILRQGDMLITNADCATDVPNQYTPVLLKKGDRFTTAYNAGTPVAYGRAAFDGQYVTYTATDPVEYIQLSYKADVDYAVKVYVAAARADEVTIPVTYAPGYLKATTGEPVNTGDGTTLYPSGYYTEQMTDLITVSAPGKFLLVKNVTLDAVHNFRSGFIWAKYGEDGAMVSGLLKGDWDLSRNYYVIPLPAQTERIRFAFTAAANPPERLEALLVDREYLIRNGYGNHLYGQSLVAFGDSYIGGWAGSVPGVRILAQRNLMTYTSFGHNGWGIAASPNYPNGLIDLVESELGSTDADYYIIQAGRNDYNCQVPIGTDDELHGPDILYTQRSFKGALNWLCQWLCQNKPTKKVAFFTPWFFPSRTTSGDDEGNGDGSQFAERQKPEEYIDAIIETAGRWGIPVLDCARDAGMHVREAGFRSSFYRNADDVSHLNAEGAALFARNVQRRFELF